MILTYKGITPTVPDSCYLYPYTTLLGNVILGEGVVICPSCTIRAEFGQVSVGAYTNIQDNSIIHVEPGFDVNIGSCVTIGHGAILHGCTVADNVLIGMGAVIQDGSIIEENCFIGAGSLVTQNTVIPAGHVAYGSPAKVVRPLRQEEWDEIRFATAEYQEYARALRTEEK